jgi:uncharacterized protein
MKHEPHSIRQLMLFLTEDCNLRCLYCFVRKTPRTMSVETARKAVDFYFSRAVSGGETHLAMTFFGGEPFLATEVMTEVVTMARRWRPNVDKRALFGATTNGTIATPAVERIIKDSGMVLLISLDGAADANQQRPFVSGRPSYAAVARNIPKLLSWARSAAVRTTFHPQALDLVANVRHVLELGAPSVVLAPVVEADWQGHEAALEDAWEAMADWYIQEARQGRILPLETTHDLLRQYHYTQRGGSRPERPCALAATILGIGPSGEILPCHRYLHHPHDWLGTLDAPDFTEARRAPFLKLASRDMLGCSTCLAEPVCGGGCRVVAIEAGLDIANGTHPGHCLTMRAHARAAYRIYHALIAEDCRDFLAFLGIRPTLTHAFGELLTR